MQSITKLDIAKQEAIKSFGFKEKDIDEDYIVIEKLGQGGFGDVYKVESKITHNVYAAKVILMAFDDPISELMSIINEIKALKTCYHENIIRIKDYFITRYKPIIVIILEYVKEGNLRKYIKPGINRRVILNVFYQMCEGIQCMHRNDIVHNDLKPENILITEDGRPIITDFGLSQTITHSSMTVKMGGWSGGYSAPEAFGMQFVKHTKKCDIYALGIMFYELHTGKLPYGTGPEFKEKC